MAPHMPHHTGNGNEYALGLERMNRFQEPEARLAIADLHLPPGSRGLDVGCGVGLYTQWLAEAIGPHGQVLGIDPSAERLATARHLIGQNLPTTRLEFRQGDGTALAAADESFDWVWCGDVLHHIDQPVVALKEFRRVLRPGGRIIIKESQVVQALFLPGHLELEKQLQRAEIHYSRHEAGARSFQERRQRTMESMGEAGLTTIKLRTYVIERQAPLPQSAWDYIQHVVFERNWGTRLRGLLDAQDWAQRSALCDQDSPQHILVTPGYYCIYSFSMFTADVPA
jgi:ubiquinone/menaquinone biosynthesis C-methylase UbiE